MKTKQMVGSIRNNNHSPWLPIAVAMLVSLASAGVRAGDNAPAAAQNSNAEIDKLSVGQSSPKARQNSNLLVTNCVWKGESPVVFGNARKSAAAAKANAGVKKAAANAESKAQHPISRQQFEAATIEAKAQYSSTNSAK